MSNLGSLYLIVMLRRSSGLAMLTVGLYAQSTSSMVSGMQKWNPDSAFWRPCDYSVDWRLIPAGTVVCVDEAKCAWNEPRLL